MRSFSVAKEFQDSKISELKALVNSKVSEQLSIATADAKTQLTGASGLGHYPQVGLRSTDV